MPSDRQGDYEGSCRVCGKHIKFVRQHERSKHGIYVQPRRTSNVKTIASKELVPVTPVVRKIETNGKPSTFKQVEGFMLIQKDDGSIWMAEKIRD
jgi:hypothetical protein